MKVMIMTIYASVISGQQSGYLLNLNNIIKEHHVKRWQQQNFWFTSKWHESIQGRFRLATLIPFVAWLKSDISICSLVENWYKIWCKPAQKQISACTQQQWSLEKSVYVFGELKFWGPVFPFAFIPQIPL